MINNTPHPSAPPSWLDLDRLRLLSADRKESSLHLTAADPEQDTVMLSKTGEDFKVSYSRPGHSVETHSLDYIEANYLYRAVRLASRDPLYENTLKPKINEAVDTMIQSLAVKAEISPLWNAVKPAGPDWNRVDEIIRADDLYVRGIG